MGFIGAGTVGTALAVRLRRQKYPIVAASSRTRASAERLARAVDECRAYSSGQEVADAAKLVFITTPDDSIGPVASQINWHRGQSVVHCSGALSVEVLEPVKRCGAQAGGFHPLQTFANVEHAIKNLPGTTFTIEGEGELLNILRELATALEGHWVRLDAKDKVLYHASAVIACNYLITLVKLATDLWQVLGISVPEAIQALLPLLRGTINNLDSVGLPDSLTGPIARGDVGTIRKHLAALEKNAVPLLTPYRELGLETIPIALAKGKIDKRRAEELRSLLKSSAQQDETAAKKAVFSFQSREVNHENDA
jgi:predicted short-subunit dehydrogenase-like oxidoreductase (DUF2520 family)